MRLDGAPNLVHTLILLSNPISHMTGQVVPPYSCVKIVSNSFYKLCNLKILLVGEVPHAPRVPGVVPLYASWAVTSVLYIGEVLCNGSVHNSSNINVLNVVSYCILAALPSCHTI